MAFGRRKPREPLDEAHLFEYAVKSLGARMQSVRDLRRKLADRATPGQDGQDAIERILTRLQEMRYLSDERFAADFTRLRQENRSLGKRRVQQDLQAKGIATDLIHETLEGAYGDLDEQTLVRQHLERRRIPAPTDQKSTARIVRRLTAAGFSPKSIFAVLRTVSSTNAMEPFETHAADLAADAPDAADPDA